MINMTNIIVLGYVRLLIAVYLIKLNVMETKSVLSDSRSILLLRFMSMVKGIKVTSLDSAAYNIPLTYSIATSLNNVELDHLIYNLEERLGV